METRLSTSSSKGRSLSRLAFFLVGLVALDSVVSVLIDRLAPPDYVKAIQSKSDFDATSPYSVWVIGDSLAADAVTPATFREASGKEVYNWGVYATSPFEWRVMVDHLLATAKPPELAIIVCHPHMFVKRPNDGPFATETFRSPDVTAGLFWGSVFRDDLSAMFASGRKKLIWKSALGRIGKRSVAPSTEFLPLDNGYQGTTKELEEVPRLMVDALRFDNHTVEFQFAAVDQLIRALQAKGCRVALAKPPISIDQLRADQRELDTWPDFQSRLERLVRERDLVVFDRQTDQYCEQLVPQDFTDAIHLSHRGSLAFSRELGEWVRVVSP